MSNLKNEETELGKILTFGPALWERVRDGSGEERPALWEHFICLLFIFKKPFVFPWVEVIKLLKLKHWFQSESGGRVRFARLVGEKGLGQSLEVCVKCQQGPGLGMRRPREALGPDRATWNIPGDWFQEGRLWGLPGTESHCRTQGSAAGGRRALGK